MKGDQEINITIKALMYRVLVTGEKDQLKDFAEKLRARLEAVNIPCFKYSGRGAVATFASDIQKLDGVKLNGMILFLPKGIDIFELTLLHRVLGGSRLRGACVCMLVESAFSELAKWELFLNRFNSYICLSVASETNDFLRRVGFDILPYMKTRPCTLISLFENDCSVII